MPDVLPKYLSMSYSGSHYWYCPLVLGPCLSVQYPIPWWCVLLGCQSGTLQTLHALIQIWSCHLLKVLPWLSTALKIKIRFLNRFPKLVSFLSLPFSLASPLTTMPVVDTPAMLNVLHFLPTSLVFFQPSAFIYALPSRSSSIISWILHHPSCASFSAILSAHLSMTRSQLLLSLACRPVFLGLVGRSNWEATVQRSGLPFPFNYVHPLPMVSCFPLGVSKLTFSI